MPKLTVFFKIPRLNITLNLKYKITEICLFEKWIPYLIDGDLSMSIINLHLYSFTYF